MSSASTLIMLRSGLNVFVKLIAHFSSYSNEITYEVEGILDGIEFEFLVSNDSTLISVGKED
jgi:hypothetical protein